MRFFLYTPVALLFGTLLFGQLAAAGPVRSSPEGRAVDYLAREVPRWFRKNQCYSCHNNGDAARALYTAVRLSQPVLAPALEDTTRWLARPRDWDRNGGRAGPGDLGLARLQFAATLVEALDAGRVKDRQVLATAAELVAAGQRKDGSWQVNADGALGSPASYGACLATYQARRVLAKADPTRYRDALAKADRWLRTVAVDSVADAAAVLLALEGKEDAVAVARRRQCLALLLKGQSDNGGWGPYVTAPAEPFDTAVVVLALVPSKEDPELGRRLRRGRAYLVATQAADGSWPETTRPPGADSYAQRLSTSAWATLALLATRTKGE